MKVLGVTQILDEYTLLEVVQLAIKDNLWERLHRVFGEQAADDEPLRCWLDLLDESGHSLEDGPIQITAAQGQWFLKDFCHRPEREWSKVRLPH